jgi:hypothetical protein
MKRLAMLAVGLAGAVARADDLPPEMKEVVGAVQAEVRLAHRHREAFQKKPADLNLLTEAERCYQRALVFASLLQQIPVELCGDALTKGTVPDAYRPTLFDVTVYDALEFYAFVGLSGADGGDAVLDVDGPAFEGVQGFRVEIPGEAAQRSRVLRALRLYQALLAFHEEDKETSAYADADLNRLLFCRLFVAGEGRDARYAAALDRFMHTWRMHEVASRATALRARIALERGDAAFARMLAQNGATAFPASIGAAQCRNLIAEVGTPDLAIAVPAVWRAPWPEFTVAYKNLTQVTFRAVAWDEAEAAVLLRRRPVRGWTAPLPPFSDCRAHDYGVTVPKDLPPGQYAVFASPDGAFGEGGAPVSWARVRVDGSDGGNAAQGVPPVAFSHLSGGWKRTVEPDDWRYRAWRGTDGRVLCHRTALREREGSDILK